MSELDGLVVVITGVGSGIGRAMAQGFQADGAFVVGGDREHMVEAASEVCDEVVAMDVRSPEDNERLVTHAVETGGRLDAFFANAGISSMGSVIEQPWERIEKVMAVNFDGVLHGLRAVLPVMHAQGAGRIAVTASRNPEICPAEMIGYNASKAAVIAAVRTVSRELEGTDILINNLIPGFSATGIFGHGPVPDSARDPALAYPTAKMLATLPTGGPSGRTFFDEEAWPLYRDFSK